MNNSFSINETKDNDKKFLLGIETRFQKSNFPMLKLNKEIVFNSNEKINRKESIENSKQRYNELNKMFQREFKVYLNSLY